MNVRIIITRDYEKNMNRTLGENKPNQSQFVFFTAENAEYAGKKDICVSDCSIKKYTLYPISPRSLRTRRLMKNKPNQSQFQDRGRMTDDGRQISPATCGQGVLRPLFAARAY
ncbi:MAG: hypothetical protein ACE5NM_05230 [Sedimentisphaerales bacterium]